MFCSYIDSLLVALSQAGVGCFIGDNFIGAQAYADDLVLAPSATALRRMLSICDKYAIDYFINFNAGKSYCLVVLPNNRRYLRDYIKECNIHIGNNPIEYVGSYVHLGHIITSQLLLTTLISRKDGVISSDTLTMCCAIIISLPRP